jgi:hypothetical protein
MHTDHKFYLHSPAQSGNLEYGKDCSVLVDMAKKDIFPPPAHCPTRNGAPPKSSSTKTQDKERKSAMAAKALVASEKNLASEAKKLAVKELQEKKK